MSSQLAAPAITAQTAITRISISRCSTLPRQRGSSKAENSSTKVFTDTRASRSQEDPSNHTKSHAVKYLGYFHADPLGRPPRVRAGPPAVEQGPAEIKERQGISDRKDRCTG